MSESRASASSFLVDELRQTRAAAGLTQEDLGRAINYSSSLVSAVENGQRPPTTEYLAAVDRALRTGGLFERLLTALSSIDRAPVWLRDWIVFEREATLLRWSEPSLVPGLLQTEEYARAVLLRNGLLDGAEIEQSVSSRMERQGILVGAAPPTFIAIMDEGVLRRRVGDARIMVEQCEHLVRSAGQPHIQIHVVPAAAGAHAGLAGGFILAGGNDFEAAQLDNSLSAHIVDHRDALDSLTRRWEAVRGEALPRTLSIDLIREVARTWQI